MKTNYITAAIILFLNFICANVSTAQDQVLTPQQEIIPLEIPHFLKADSLGEIQKWHVGNLEFHPSHLLKIYNRRGVLIFQTKKYENDWPVSQYTENRFLFVLEIEDKRINGWVEIER